jgi:hypothetical protein
VRALYVNYISKMLTAGGRKVCAHAGFEVFTAMKIKSWYPGL